MQGRAAPNIVNAKGRVRSKASITLNLVASILAGATWIPEHWDRVSGESFAAIPERRSNHFNPGIRQEYFVCT